jgi:hypothetical protein
MLHGALGRSGTFGSADATENGKDLWNFEYHVHRKVQNFKPPVSYILLAYNKGSWAIAGLIQQTFSYFSTA